MFLPLLAKKSINNLSDLIKKYFSRLCKVTKILKFCNKVGKIEQSQSQEPSKITVSNLRHWFKSVPILNDTGPKVFRGQDLFSIQIVKRGKT